MLRPSLIMRWMRPANCVGSSRLKPEVTSSDFRIQRGLFLFNCSHSCETSLTFLVFFFFLLLLLFLLLAVSHLLFFRLFDIKLDWEADEFRMLFDQILEAALFQEFGLVLLQVTYNLGATLELTVDEFGVFLHSEGTTCCGFPYILLVVVVFTHDAYFVGNQICGVKANTKLTNHRNVATSSHSLHEGFRARFRDGTQVVDAH